MGLDRLFQFLSPGYGGLNCDFKMNRDFKRKFCYVKGSSVLYVVLTPPRRGGKYINSNLGNEIMKLGHSYLDYEFAEKILSADYNSTKKNFRAVEKFVDSDLKKLKKRYGFSEINVIGISLTCVSVPMIANGNPIVNKVVLVVPGNCLAESMWGGIRTQHLRKEYEKNGICLEKLKKCWRDLAPENNLDKLKGKKIYVYLSKADRIVPYCCGKKLVKAMRDKGLNPCVNENRFLGHIGTLYWLSNNAKKILKDIDGGRLSKKVKCIRKSDVVKAEKAKHAAKKA